MAIAMRFGAPLPEPLERGLRKVGQRWKRLGAMRGLGRLLVALVGFALLAMALDFWLPLPAWFRWVLWLGWLGLAGYGLVVGVFQVLAKRLGWQDLAALAEVGHPDLAERISSTVGLLNPNTRAHGSQALITALADDTVGRVRSLDLTRGLSSVVPRRWLTAGLAAVAALALPPLIQPDPFAKLARRFFQPWTETAHVGRLEILVQPGDVVAASGDDLELKVDVRRRFALAGSLPETVALEWTGEDGRPHRQNLQALATRAAAIPASAEERQFSGSIKAVENTLEYRVVSGADHSRWHKVTVVDPPAVQQLVARVQPPEYTRFPAAQVRDADRISAWEGSEVLLTVTPNRPMTRVAVSWPAAPEAAGVLTEGRETPVPVPVEADREVVVELKSTGTAWAGTIRAERSGTYRILLEDEHHLVNHRPEAPRRLIVVPDMPPELAIGGTDDALEVRGDDVILIEVAASDDVAVSDVSLRYVVNRSGLDSHGVEGASRPDQGEIVASLSDLGTPLARGQVALPLKTLGLRPGDVVAYAIEATDNYPPPRGPHKTRTKPRRVIVRDQADSFAERQGRAERENLRARLEQLKTLVNAHHQATVQLRYVADAALRGNGQWEAQHASGLGDRIRESDQQIKLLNELAGELADAGRFAILSKPAQQLADVEAAGAREVIGRAAEEKEAAKRLANLRLADARIGAMETRLAELIKKFDELAKEDEDRRKLQQLAESQEDLARRAEQMADAQRDPADLEALKRDQDALRQQVDDIVRRSPELKADMLAKQVEQADELARAARELAERQRVQERETAESPVRQALLREIAKDQDELAHDARKLALDVDGPLQENGRGKINLETLTQPIDPLERGDLEPARQRIEQAQGELTRLTRDMDDVRGDPKALARRLAQRQDEVAQRLTAALKEAADTPEKQAVQAKTIESLIQRQEAVAQMAAALVAPEPQKAVLEQAREATSKALEAVRGKPDQAQVARAQEAKEALQRLANELPEAWQRRQQAQKQIQEARQKLEEVTRAVEGHLRETAAAAASNKQTPAKAARELAGKLEPLAQQAEQAAKTLAGVDTVGTAEPQRVTAQHRAESLAALLKEVQKAVPSEADAAQQAEPAADWRLLGPFDRNTPPPFSVTEAVDFKAAIPARNKKPVTWLPVPSGAQGKVDLKQLLADAGSTDNSTAFGVTEVSGGAGGPGQLSIGCDDSIIVWLNGIKVFEFGGPRGWQAGQDQVNVTFLEGPNQLVVACGNGTSEWAFSVAASAPPTGEVAEQLAQVDQLRRRLELSPADARTSVDRLQQALDGRSSPDQRAQELAAELKAMLELKMSPDQEYQILRQAAAALRTLNVPDAPTFQAEAVRLAEQAANDLVKANEAAEAAKGNDQPPLEAAAEARAHNLKAAAQAAETLARRLADTLPASEQAAALARAQEALTAPLKEPDAVGQAKQQYAIAADLTRLTKPADPDASATSARSQAEQGVKQAAALNDRVASPSSPAESSRPLTEARRQAAKALGELAQALDAGQGNQPPENPQAQNGGAGAENLPAPLLGQTQPQDPELGLADAHREAARDLAMRQRRISEQLQAVLGSEMKPQEALREAAAELAGSLDSLRQQLGQQGLSQAAQGPAQAAANTLQQQATNAMNQSLEHLAQGRLPSARDSQRQAADHLENAARQASDLASALRKDIPADAQARGDGAGQEADGEANRDALASAREAQNQAAQELDKAQQAARGQNPGKNSEAATKTAAEAMRQAAQGRRAAASNTQAGERLAQSLREQRSQKGATPPEAQGATPESSEGQEVASHLGALDPAQLARSGRRWGELPGHLKNEILQMSQGRYRDDYARLIQLYFREIGGAPTDVVPGANP